MAKDSKLPVVIFFALVALIATPVLIDYIREIRRPVIMEVRVVTAAASDPVFRQGRRHVEAGELVEAAVALRYGRSGTPGQWLAPVERLVIDGGNSGHQNSETWPEEGRSVRVFWFSVESTNLGGSLNAENAADRLRYRTFLAPEMGRNMRAERLPEIHNDDHIGQHSTTIPDGAGTVRLYARVEVVETDSDLRPLQVVTSTSLEEVLNPGFPAVLRAADLGEGINSSVGEFFGLPGFEPRSPTGAWNEVTLPAFQMPFTDLVSERFVVSSRSLAAIAVSGEPAIDTGALTALGTLSITQNSVLRGGRVLGWGSDVNPGDLLVNGDHWWVLLGDSGSGTLDPSDPVLHCWGRPPERTTLDASLETQELTVEHFRHER